MLGDHELERGSWERQKRYEGRSRDSNGMSLVRAERGAILGKEGSECGQGESKAQQLTCR